MTFSLFTRRTQISDILLKSIGSLSIFQLTFYQVIRFSKDFWSWTFTVKSKSIKTTLNFHYIQIRKQRTVMPANAQAAE